GRQRLSRRSQWRTHADAMELRSQCRILALQSPTIDPADHHRPRIPLRGGQRRDAAGQPQLAAVVDQAAHRPAAHAPGVRARLEVQLGHAREAAYTPPTVVMAGEWTGAMAPEVRGALEEALPAYLIARRWYVGVERVVESAHVVDAFQLGGGVELLLVRIEY